MQVSFIHRRRLLCVCSIVIIVVSTVKVLVHLVASLILREKNSTQNKHRPPQSNKKSHQNIPKQKTPRDYMFSSWKSCWKQLSAYVLSIVFWFPLQCYMLMSLDLISEDSSLYAFYVTKQLKSKYVLKNLFFKKIHKCSKKKINKFLRSLCFVKLLKWLCELFPIRY